MKIITISNRKGGIGKTTTAKALSDGLKNKGFKVLRVDLDTQKNFTPNTQDNSHYTIYDFFTGKASINECINDGDYIPGTEFLAVAEVEINKKQFGKEYILKDALETLKSIYDYIVIDTPPEINIMTINALVCANYVIIPTTTLLNSLKGVNMVLDSIDDIKKYCPNNNIEKVGALITMNNNRAIIYRDLKDQLKLLCERRNIKLFETVIRNNISIPESEAMQGSIFTYAPKSNGAKDYNSFINEFLEETK